ncbi:phage portal protein [Thiotrichales bacterium 19S3-7]|nr:phage portal protein [Thiotrichales bacterium 19S3-7]
MKLFGFGTKKQQALKATARSSKLRFYDAVDSELVQEIKSLFVDDIDINEIISTHWRTITGRARKQYNNNDYLRHFVSLACVNVVGYNGIQVQCQSQNKELNNHTESLFKLWCESCDVTDRLSFIDVQILAIKSMVRDGEFILIKHIDDEYQLRLQLIDPSRLDPSHNIELSNGRKIVNGIEVNRLGKPLAYHFRKANSSETVRISAEYVIHGFVPEYIGQNRGISWFITSMIRSHLLKEYETAAVDHAKTGAKVIGTFRSSEEYAQPDDQAPDIKQFEGSGMFELPPGYQFDGFDPAYPTGEYALFKTSILQAISGSLGYGVSYVSLANDLKGVSYSSARQGALAERDAWRMVQQHLISQLIRPIYRAWLEVEWLSSRLNCSDSDYQALKLASYQPRSWGWVDPVKEVKAMEMLLRNFLKSRKQIISENGLDIEKIDEEIKAEMMKFDEFKNISPEYITYLIGTFKSIVQTTQSDDL